MPELIDNLVAGLIIMRYYDRTDFQTEKGMIYFRTALSDVLIKMMGDVGWHYDRNNYRVYILTD